jgi:hypothetical protein
MNDIENNIMASGGGGGGLFGDDDDDDQPYQPQGNNEGDADLDHDDILGLEDVDEDADALARAAAADHEGGLLMRFCPHDSSMLYPKVSLSCYLFLLYFEWD